MIKIDLETIYYNSNKMSIFSRAKEAHLKKLEEEKEETQFSSDDDEPNVEESFQLYEKKWILAPNMQEISKGELNLIPIECMLTHYILKYDFHCLYIALDNHETGDAFEIYEFNWIGVSDEHAGEKFEPEFTEIESTLSAVETARFLADRIKDGYMIYIEERKEFE